MLKFCASIIIISAINLKVNHAAVTDKQYATMPVLFQMDNYDNCMLQQDEALYCFVTFQLQPLNASNVSDVWNIIQEVNLGRTNYQHDFLRLGVCASQKCPQLSAADKNDAHKLERGLNAYLNEQYGKMDFKGMITKMRCQTHESDYPVTNTDIAVAVAFVSYLLFVFYASLYEGTARYESKEFYEKRISTPFGRIMSAFSLSKNWYRLKTIHDTPDVFNLKCIQGVRTYNLFCVILCHTIIMFVATPLVNTRYTETMHEKFVCMFFSNGTFAVSTYFLITSWLISYNLFEAIEANIKLTPKILLIILLNRYFRIVPVVAAVYILHSTWMVHTGDGPIWDEIVGSEYRDCRANGWSNLLFIHNYINYDHMCMMHTWYLGRDTQLFIVCLILIYLMTKFDRFVIIYTWIFGTTFLTFCMNYYKNYEASIIPTAESAYMMNLLKDDQWHYTFGGLLCYCPSIGIGLLCGHYYAKYKNEKLFQSKMIVVLWWILVWGSALGVIILPGLYIYDINRPHNIFWASVFASTGKVVFIAAIALAIFGQTQGIGWMMKWCCEWSPTYVMGRLTFSTFVVHLFVIKVKMGRVRSPIYIDDFLVAMEIFSNVVLSYICGLLLTLLVELPTTELQKMFVPQRAKDDANEVKKQK